MHQGKQKMTNMSGYSTHQYYISYELN